MSDYRRMKVVRYKLKPEDLEHYGVKDAYELEEKFEDVFLLRKEGRGFEVAPTDSSIFLDCILIDEEGYGEYGKTRKLSDNEISKYLTILQSQFQDMDRTSGNVHQWLPDRNNLRLVDFCWYDCSEAPDYFDSKGDPFYDEV